MLMEFRRLVFVVLCFCVITTTPSCVSFPGKKLAEVDEKNLRSQIQTMFVPSVAVRFRMFTDRKGKATEVVDDNVKREAKIFNAYIDKTHMVRRIEDDKKSDFVIDMQIRQDVSKQNEYWLMASAATLTLVPYWGRTYLTGQLTLKDRGGKLLKSYDARDSYLFLVNMFVAPAMPFYWSRSIEQDVRSNLYRHLIAQLVKDGIQITNN